tara:strand:- start:1554 stop:1805 length:252 start_codon:yes stop_codon:yes gene_type:complete
MLTSKMSPSKAHKAELAKYGIGNHGTKIFDVNCMRHLKKRFEKIGVIVGLQTLSSKRQSKIFSLEPKLPPWEVCKNCKVALNE